MSAHTMVKVNSTLHEESMRLARRLNLHVLPYRENDRQFYFVHERGSGTGVRCSNKSEVYEAMLAFHGAQNMGTHKREGFVVWAGRRGYTLRTAKEDGFSEELARYRATTETRSSK